jgi:hypothetical protein
MSSITEKSRKKAMMAAVILRSMAVLLGCGWRAAG